MVTKDRLKDYFAKARRFDQDRLLMARRSIRIAWFIAAGASCLAALAVGAVAALAPLKAVEPFVIRVDNATGIVDVVSALSATPDRYDDAVTKYFAARYVRAREGYVASEAEDNFRTVSLFSSSAEQGRFATFYRGTNPDSPQNTYGRFATAKIGVKSISLINAHVVSVRYIRDVTRGDDLRRTHWVATLTFSYTRAPISAHDRLTNPLGFVVSEYRADPEALP